ncbi:MAG: hypothetical protein NT018_05005 [Armatimonadetes bacterium]|nr:hypothetical protein [Armatimonadota bacterium]
MRLDYPNAFDQAMAKADGRTKLGSDIMIHGDRVSIGCVAVGDQASEDLFVLAADIGMSNVEVTVAPYDFRSKQRGSVAGDMPKWAGGLYDDIEKKMVELQQ